MSEIAVKPVLNFQGSLQTGCHILVINAHKKPPHIALVHDGTVYSLEYSGLNIKTIDVFLRTINGKKRPTLIVSLKTQFEGSHVNHIFSLFSLTDSKNTCLSPIKELFRLDDLNYVFELIPELERRNQVKEYGHLHLDPYISNNVFKFQTYTKEEILEHIKKLRRSND